MSVETLEETNACFRNAFSSITDWRSHGRLYLISFVSLPWFHFYRQECSDWSLQYVIYTWSGGAWYRTRFNINVLSYKKLRSYELIHREHFRTFITFIMERVSGVYGRCPVIWTQHVVKMCYREIVGFPITPPALHLSVICRAICCILYFTEYVPFMIYFQHQHSKRNFGTLQSIKMYLKVLSLTGNIVQQHLHGLNK